MKLAIIGGGGVRAPFLARSVAKAAEEIGLDELTLMDSRPDRLRIFGSFAKRIAELNSPRLRVDATLNLEEALDGADYIITTMRPGFETARATDERTCLDAGVIGQETVGAGGFSMAMRTIPAMLLCCETSIRRSANNAVIFNFTNPSGLVTQAMRDSGYANVFGVCDMPSTLLSQIAILLGVEKSALKTKCFGLNHLSFFSSVKLAGEEILPALLADKRLYEKTDMRYFPAEFASRKSMLINEYLYYYYFPNRALSNIAAQSKTRGERIELINESMIKALEGLDLDKEFGAFLDTYRHFQGIRESEYMANETKLRRVHEEFRFDPTGADEGGYAGIVLDYLKAIAEKAPREMILNVPNKGAIGFLADDDIVELTCEVGPAGMRLKSPGFIPEAEGELIRRVKTYERLASRSILSRNRNSAIDALSLNPLVASYDTAEILIDKFTAVAGVPDYWRKGQR